MDEAGIADHVRHLQDLTGKNKRPRAILQLKALGEAGKSIKA
jgi:hypothetical protein